MDCQHVTSLCPLLPRCKGGTSPCSRATWKVTGGPWSSQEKAGSVITHQETVSVTSLLTGYLKLYNSKAASKSPHIKVHHLPWQHRYVSKICSNSRVLLSTVCNTLVMCQGQGTSVTHCLIFTATVVIIMKYDQFLIQPKSPLMQKGKILLFPMNIGPDL